LAQLRGIIPQNITKRDGTLSPFDVSKISTALANASKTTSPFTNEEVINLTNHVLDSINKQHKKDQPVFIEKIQDLVEMSLFAGGHFEIAKNYILYREKRNQVRNMVDVEKVIEEYLRQLDWRVNENANVGYSLGGMILNTSGNVTANYWLNCIYPKEIGEAHRSGDFHLHDLSMLSGYCAGWSLRQLLEEGFNGVPGHIEAGPPKHLSSAIGQMVNFMGTLQNEWAGAQAFSSVDTYLAPFVRLGKMTYKEVKQKIQELVFNLSIPSRWGTQTPFTNFTFDIVCPEDLKSQRPKIGGGYVDFTYGDLQGNGHDQQGLYRSHGDW